MLQRLIREYSEERRVEKPQLTLGSANMHATSGKMQESIDRSCVLVEGTLLEVRKIGDLLPGIFTQLSVIEGKLQALDQRMKNGSEEVLSVPLRRDMNPVIQHLMVRLKLPTI